MQEKIEIRQIRPSDRLTGLSLGDPVFLPLKIFLQKHAKVYHERNLARTYAAFDASQGNKVVAYTTLVSGEIVLEGDKSLLDEPDVHYNYKSYPALKIARLAVHEKYRGYGLGQLLVQLALGTAKEIICPAIGCRFVAVDSKRQAVDFYLKQGFALLDTRQNRDRSEPVLFIDLHKAS
ncbi:GNAT family N-acetyltransferase [Bradyrhizobium sp. SZCCHNR1045]|uniref:GNAT family N-acetyltransferase n=1 Tax=Bradyrhizobium sp. SZCCHNR1045 TaxID=3057353 RepID=UPI0029162660|nr:GNAT family N-acetyltransferase [Bradyrhizobium sp. SZCCHNR1045]